ncbi:hypothetical protein ABIB85_008266 [Bradyrhizobium sp. JR1.5]
MIRMSWARAASVEETNRHLHCWTARPRDPAARSARPAAPHRPSPHTTNFANAASYGRSAQAPSDLHQSVIESSHPERKPQTSANGPTGPLQNSGREARSPAAKQPLSVTVTPMGQGRHDRSTSIIRNAGQRAIRSRAKLSWALSSAHSAPTVPRTAQIHEQGQWLFPLARQKRQASPPPSTRPATHSVRVSTPIEALIHP